MNQIPWRDNGILVAAIGAMLFAGLTLAEFVFQRINYQEPVLHFDLQVNSEIDTEEDDEGTVNLSPDDVATARTILTALVNKEDKTVDWAWLQQQFPQSNDEIWLDVAQSASKRRYRHSAKIILQQLLTTNPQSLPALYQLAKLAGDSDNDKLAIEHYQHLLDIHPNHQASMINLGLLLAREGRHREVIEVQTRAIDISSGVRKAKAYSIRASSHLDLKDYLAGIKDFQSSIQFRPTHAPTWRKLANALLMGGADNAEIVKAFDQAVSLQADYLQALHERGRFQWLRGEYALARQDLEKVKAVAPEYLTGRWSLLHLYIDMGKRRSASEEIRWLKKQELEPGNRQFIVGLEYWFDKEYSKAEPIFATLATEQPNEPWVQYYLALTESHLSQSEQSLVIAQLQDLSLDPWMHSIASIALSEAYNNSHLNEQAITVLQELTNQYPQSHAYAYLLGKTYLDSDLYLEAASALQRALKLDESDSQTRLSLGIAYRRAEQNDLALKTYEELLSLRPNHRAGRYNYALLLDSLKRSEEAIVEYQQALQRDPSNTSIMFRLASLYADQQQFQQAKDLVAEALAERPTYHRARELLVDIYLRQNTLDQALDEVNRLLVLQSNRVSAKLLKSDILRDQNRLQEAADILLTLPSEDYSRNALVKLFNIGKRALDTNDLNLAEVCNRNVIEHDEGFDKAWVNLSSALNRNQKYQETIALLVDKKDMLNTNYKLVINLAQAHHLSGNSKDAIALLEPLQRQDLLSDEGELVLTASYQSL